MESTACMICVESALVACCGAVDIANAAHRTAPTRYANDENAVTSEANSRLSNSCRVLGLGISYKQVSSHYRLPMNTERKQNWAKK